MSFSIELPAGMLGGSPGGGSRKRQRVSAGRWLRYAIACVVILAAMAWLAYGRPTTLDEINTAWHYGVLGQAGEDSTPDGHWFNCHKSTLGHPDAATWQALNCKDRGQ